MEACSIPVLNGQPISQYFPFKEYRVHQRETLDKIEAALRVGKRYVIVEAPTGAGKSPMAVSAGLWAESAYILTSQKILQDQYTKDFADGNDISVIKGRGNYECNFLGAPASCNECYEPAKKNCIANSECFYYNAKAQAVAAKVALMNYAYFLSMMECDPSKKFGKRGLLIMDECHNIEKQLMSYIEFVISEFTFKQYGYPVSIPEYEDIEQYVKWIETNHNGIVELMKSKQGRITYLNERRAAFRKTSREFATLSLEVKELSEAAEDLDRLNRRIRQFLETIGRVEWIFTVEYTEKTHTRRVTFRPLTVSHFAYEALFQHGEQCLLMSATILDHHSFCRSLGIPMDQVEFISVESTFPPEIRKIIFTNTGAMSMSGLTATLPNIARDIKKALNYHKLEKGIIHCHTYKIANYIKENVNSDRFIFHDSSDRDAKLAQFIGSKTPKVLVTPSMTEGVDLKGDLARWEVIIKIPYLYLGDKQISRRMQVDPEWYNWQTCLVLVQSYGRIFRAEDDWGTAYVFDSGAPYFIKKNQSILPKWFLDAIVQKKRS